MMKLQDDHAISLLKERSQQDLSRARQRATAKFHEALARKDDLSDFLRVMEVHIAVLETESVVLHENLA